MSAGRDARINRIFRRERSKMARDVTLIPANPHTVTRNGRVQEREALRVAAYCRVSTNNEDQLLSFDNQVQYYTEYIANKPDYTLAGIYADEGISGVSTNKREQFKKMIKDCEDGKIDMVITKSISRFARNTQDCLQYSRKLKNLGIGIFFEKENINTLDAAGELLFTIMSSLAQEESRSISENCRWGIRTKFKQGVMHLNANHFLGYDKDEKGNLVINEAQAAIVRRVFDEFMNGLNPEVIAAELNGEGVPGCMGEPKWAVSTIMHILENEKYKGDALLQKYYTSDFLSKRSVRNMGQVEQVYVKDSHPPIVDRELWEAVQLEIERRRLFREKHNLQNMGRYTDVQPFTCKCKLSRRMTKNKKSAKTRKNLQSLKMVCYPSSRQSKKQKFFYPVSRRVFLCSLLQLLFIKFHWCHNSQIPLYPFVDVIVNIIFDCLYQRLFCFIFSAIIHFTFHDPPKPFHWTIVNTSANS